MEIQRGVRLKKAKCNDRSRPNLNGLGVFRRQLSTVDVPDALEGPSTPLIEPEADYDDIDKVRDDLQSTKQLLEIELKNRVKIDNENAKLQTEIRRLKEELTKKPSSTFNNSAPQPIQSSASNNKINLKKSTSRMQMLAKKKASKKDSDDSSEEEDDFGELDAVEEEMNALRGQAELARKTAEEFESRYKETAGKLVTTQAEMEDLEVKVAVLQKKLKRAAGGVEPVESCHKEVQTDPMPEPEIIRPVRSHSKRDLRKQMSRQDSRGSNLSSSTHGDGTAELSGDEEDELEEEDEVAGSLKAQKRELSLLLSKLRSTKDKEKNTRNERIALHINLKKFRSDLKDEKKK